LSEPRQPPSSPAAGGWAKPGVYPVTFQQALAPLASLAREAVTSGQCPGLKVGEGNVVHSYDFEARMKTRGTGETKRWVDGWGCGPMPVQQS